MDWFTSDLHLGHTGILSLSKRPFASIEEMDQTLIQNILDSTSKGDRLFILGDLSFKAAIARKALLAFRDHGLIIFWITGNHDHKSMTVENKELCSYADYVLNYVSTDGYQMYLQHNPCIVWDHSFLDVPALYGHVHAFSLERETLDQMNWGKSLNVNVEFHDYKPWSLDEIKAVMETKPHNFDHVLLINRDGNI